MQNNPLVSVVMSVFNTEKYAGEAIESILNQTYSYFEFIIVDDGSTDASLRIIKKYADEDKRIRIYINDKNIGLAKSLNKGIDISRGEYIARMDADDVSMPDRFGKQVAYLMDHPEICILGGQIKFIGSSNDDFHYAIEKELLRWQLLLNIPIIAHPTVMMKRQPIIAAGKYSESYLHAEDRALWNNLYIQHEFPAANLPDIVLHYRIHGNNVSAKNIDLQLVANQKLTHRLFTHEFHTHYDENVINNLINSVPLTSRQANIVCQLVLNLFHNFVLSHHIDEDSITTKLKQTTATYIFSKIYRFPLHGFLQIAKSIFFYPPIAKTYLNYYFSIPSKILRSSSRKLRIIWNSSQK